MPAPARWIDYGRLGVARVLESGAEVPRVPAPLPRRPAMPEVSILVLSALPPVVPGELRIPGPVPAAPVPPGRVDMLPVVCAAAGVVRAAALDDARIDVSPATEPLAVPVVVVLSVRVALEVLASLPPHAARAAAHVAISTTPRIVRVSLPMLVSSRVLLSAARAGSIAALRRRPSAPHTGTVAKTVRHAAGTIGGFISRGG